MEVKIVKEQKKNVRQKMNKKKSKTSKINELKRTSSKIGNEMINEEENMIYLLYMQIRTLFHEKKKKNLKKKDESRESKRKRGFIHNIICRRSIVTHHQFETERRKGERKSFCFTNLKNIYELSILLRKKKRKNITILSFLLHFVLFVIFVLRLLFHICLTK